MKRCIPFLVFIVMLLQACSLTSPGMKNTLTALPPTAVVASTTPARPGVTSTPPSQPPLPIVYYYFIALESNTYPAGSVTILPDELVLGPTLSKSARSADPMTNISFALRAMINDPRNAWKSADVGIAGISLKDGSANVALQGEYSAPGDVVLIAARYQILLTVFAEQSVQSAIVSLNGENIANLGISHTSEAKPDDYSFSRKEIETFLADNAYP